MPGQPVGSGVKWDHLKLFPSQLNLSIQPVPLVLPSRQTLTGWKNLSYKDLSNMTCRSNSSQQICWSILPMAKYEMGSWLARRSTHGTNSNFRIQYHNLGLGPFNPISVPSFKSEFQTYSVLAHHHLCPYSPFPFPPPAPWSMIGW